MEVSAEVNSEVLRILKRPAMSVFEKRRWNEKVSQAEGLVTQMFGEHMTRRSYTGFEPNMLATLIAYSILVIERSGFEEACKEIWQAYSEAMTPMLMSIESKIRMSITNLDLRKA